MGEEFKLKKRTPEELLLHLSTKVALLEVQVNDLQEAVSHLAPIIEDNDRLLQDVDRRTMGDKLVGPGHRGYFNSTLKPEVEIDPFDLPTKEAMKRAVLRKDVEKITE